MNSSIIRNAAFTGMISVALVWQAGADCRFQWSAEGKPDGFSKKTSAQLNPSRNEIAPQSKVEKVSASEIVESGIIEAGSRSSAFGQWGCNFSDVRTSDGRQVVLTAKHCVGNEFDWVNSDAWDSEGFFAASVRVKIAKRASGALEAASGVPENGSPIVLSGCVPSVDGCFRVEWSLEDLFVKDEEAVRGIWLTVSDYSKMVGDNIETALDGYSWTPALDAEWKVFWVVSATLQADFKEDSNGKCLPNAFGIAIAPMRR